MKRQPFMQIRLIEESQKMEAWMGRTRTESTTTKSHTQRARHQQERTVSRCCGIVRVVRQHCNDACSRLLICISYVRLAFKMFGFHKPKMYRSLDGCCICRAKSSSSRFTDSKRYENDFTSCFGLCETRSGEICNACVLLVKRCKKLPVGSKKNWNHVVDARGGPSLKISSRPKKRKSLSKRAMPIQISRLQKELKRNNSDAHSTTSSVSPAQSPSYSNPSDEGSDTELSPGSSRSPVFSFLDLTYWKRQKVCCGIIYKGRFGEVLIDPHLFKPCCRKKRQLQEEEEVEVVEVVVRKEDEVVRSDSQESSESPQLQVIMTTSQTKVEVEEEDWRYCTTV